MRTIFSDLAEEIADVWACNRPTRKQVLATIAGCLALFGILAAVEVSHRQHINEIKTLLAAHSYTPVQKQLEDLKGQAFCLNLVGRYGDYHVRIDEHNQIARLYNEAVAHAPNNGHTLPEPMMQIVPVTRADINGIVFLGHINPWQDCYARYRIAAYARSS